MATHKQGNKETSNNQRQKKNEMKSKPIEFQQDANKKTNNRTRTKHEPGQITKKIIG